MYSLPALRVQIPQVVPPALSIFKRESEATMGALFDDSKTPQQVMEAVGHGGASRMKAQQATTSCTPLSSLQHFFERGSSKEANES